MEILRGHVQAGRRAHAYLFAGPDGVGKRLSASELAKTLNCEAPGATERPASGPLDACDRCPSCQRIARKVHPDVHEVTTQGAADLIRIEEIRQMLSRMALRPYMGRAQVAIIDGADRLTEEAANSLLKGLEEPSPQTVFALLTAQPARCLPTILSRCQLIRFHPLPTSVIEGLLASGKHCGPEAAGLLARLAQGSLARAVELAKEWPAYEGIREHLRQGSISAWSAWTAPSDRAEVAQWLALSIGWLRDLAVAAAGDDQLIGHADPETISRQAKQLGAEPCAQTALELVELFESLDRMANPRLVAALLRERWLNLLGNSAVGHG